MKKLFKTLFVFVLFGLSLFVWAESGQAVTIVSQSLSEITKKADVICLGVLVDSKATLHSYEYGKSSKTWDEISLVFSVEECLKGALSGQQCSGTFVLPSFADYNEPGRQEQECPVMDGSGIESTLQASTTYLFFLDTSLGSNTVIRVEPATLAESVQKALSRLK